jgi:integrase
MGYFFDYLNIHQNDLEECFEILTQRLKADCNWFGNAIFRYLQDQKGRVERKEISSATLLNYIKPIKLYCELLDMPISWKKIMRGMPKGRRYANDRAPTLDEIKKVIAYPDRRIKPIIYTMVSSGIRLGAWDYLRWRHIVPIWRDGEVIAAKICVYGDDDEQYFSFITPEAYDSLNQWMEYRKQCGESITGESWLMRNLWDVTTPKGKGVVTIPKKLQHAGVKRLIERALWAQRVRTKLGEGKRRHAFQADHGFRKWFETRCISAGMISENVKVLMNHSLGVSDSYYRPIEEEILNDYLKAVDVLTFDRDNIALRKEIMKLKKNSEDDYTTLKRKLEEKDREILSIRMKSKSTDDKVNRLLSILVKEGVDGKPALGKEVFERLVMGEEDRLRLSTTDCEYEDLIEYDVPSEDILIVRKEKKKRKDSSG